jgi:hypothetical protein
VVLFGVLMDNIDIIGDKLTAEYFTVYHILATSQRNDIDLVFSDGPCLHNRQQR